MDISKTIEPKSDQLNADDLIAGPITVTVTRVDVPGGDQPVHLHIGGYEGRPYKPSKSMRRVLVAAWGPDSDAYIGQSLTLFRNPDITFGRDTVGGIQIEAMTGIDKPLVTSLTVKRGKRAPFTVHPLKIEHSTAKVTLDQVNASADVDQLREWWHEASQEVRDAIKARVDYLNAQPADGQEALDV